MKGGVLIALICIIAIFLMSAVSANILLSQTENVYNIGDELNIDVTLKPSAPINDFLIVNLACTGQTIEIQKNIINLGGNEEKVVNVDLLLSQSLIGSLVGICRVDAFYGVEKASTNDFEISNIINIDLDLETRQFNPGEKVGFSGKVLKKNGEKVNGFIEVIIESLSLKVSKTVSDGKFSFNFTLPDSAIAGQHIVTARIYEKDNLDSVSNEGTTSETIEIVQVLDGIEINIESASIYPGQNLVFSVIPVDQAGQKIDREIGLVLYEPGDFVYQKKLINAGEEIIIPISLNNTPGYWKIEVSAGELSAKKLFYIEEHTEVLFSLINNTLIATNVGNVPYEKNVEIGIGSATELQHIELGFGESKKYKLKAPDGEYLIKTNDGRGEVLLGNTFLTGRAVGIGETGFGLFENTYLNIILVLVIIISILGLTYYFIRKKTKLKKPVNESSGLGTVNSIISHGKKEEATVIALRLENELSANNSLAIDNALSAAKEFKANIYIDDTYRIILFSPLLTKNEENEKTAVKTGKKIEEILKGKVNFGIGINNGEIISEIKNGRFRFTSVGNIITNAKKIANNAKNKILVSESVHNRILGSVKTKKVEGEKIWDIEKIADREKHNDFIAKFKKNLNRK